MKAIRIHGHGGPEVLAVEDIPVPVPGQGQVLVKLAAIGVNFIDVYHRTGLYQSKGMPFTPGVEGAGVVEAVGDGVRNVAAGDRVAFTGPQGSYAEYQVVPADRLVPVPDDVSLEDAAAAMLQGMTAHYLTTSTYPLRQNQDCLVHAAAGGVGLLLCQMARNAGASVIGTVSTERKAALAREAGAQHVIRYTEQDFETEVKLLTAGRGVHVVYDGVGRTTFDKSLNCLRRRGMMVLFGQASGPVPPVDPAIFNVKGSLFFTRPSLFAHIAERPELESRAADVFSWIEQGKLHLRKDRMFPLEEAADAHRALEGRGTTGKVLLIP